VLLWINVNHGIFVSHVSIPLSGECYQYDASRQAVPRTWMLPWLDGNKARNYAEGTCLFFLKMREMEISSADSLILCVRHEK
jgi:hypothetical protein